jgi:hypothetical protein
MYVETLVQDHVTRGSSLSADRNESPVAVHDPDQSTADLRVLRRSFAVGRPHRLFREPLLFTTLVIAHLFLVWAFTYVPTQDGPTHLNNVEIIRDLGQPNLTVLGEFYTLNYTLAPNWFDHAALLALTSLFPMLLAEKIFLSGYVVLLPLAMRYALRALNPGAAWLTILGFPFIYNYLFHMGFYNFSYSLPMYFVVVGFALRHRNGFTWRNGVWLAALSLLLYFCHVVSLVMAYIAIAALVAAAIVAGLAQALRDGQSGRRAVCQAVQNCAAPAFAAALPVVGLSIGFLVQQGGLGHVFFVPRAILLDRLVHLDALVSFDERERWLSTAVVSLFCIASVYLLICRLPRRRVCRSDMLLPIAALYALLYLLAPYVAAGGGWVNDRLSLYPFFAVLLWFGAQSFRRSACWLTAAAGLGITGGLLALHLASYARLSPYLVEYTSAAALIEPNTTLLPLCFSFGQPADSETLSTRVAPFVHTAGYIAASRGVVDLNNYEATASYFPTRFRPQLDPFKSIGVGRWECTPEAKSPRVEFLTYPQRTGGRVDYVLLWGVRNEQHSDPDAQSVFRQLDQGYELIQAWSEPAAMQLYRRKAGA